MSNSNPPNEPGLPDTPGGGPQQPSQVPPTQPVPTAGYPAVPHQGNPVPPQGGQPGPPGGQPGPPGGQQPYPGGQQGYPGGQQGYPGGQQPYPGGQQPHPGGQQPYPGGQPGYPGGQQRGPWPPQGPQGPAGPGYGGPPKNSNNKLLVMVIAGVVLAAIIGGILMFAFGKKGQDPKPPNIPTVSGPSEPGPTTPTGRPTTSGGTPSTRSTGGTPAPAAGGTQVDVAQGVKASLPAGWEIDKKVSGGIIVVNKQAATYLQLQAFAGQKQTNLELCQLLEDAASKDLGNVKKSACKVGPDSGKVKTALGAVSGTYSTSQGSLTLSTAVFAGVRDDGLVTGTQLTYPTRKPPTEAQIKEAVLIWTSVIASQESQS